MVNKQFTDALKDSVSQRGASLMRLSVQAPVMVVFLRHAGCTFCREALADLRGQRGEIESLGVTLALVHMSEPIAATSLMAAYNLDTVHRFSDPGCLLYRAFGLKRGSLRQLFGLKVVARGVRGLFAGHGIGMLQGDGFRMPGTFVLKDGKLVSEFYAQTAADRPSYVEIAAAAVNNGQQPQQAAPAAGRQLSTTAEQPE